MRRLILALSLSLFWVSEATAVVGTLVPSGAYYVNQSIGSDSNNGTSPTTPFLTIAKLLTVFGCGQLAAVYGGASTQLKYREQFTGNASCTTTNKQALVGYGAFPPLFDASDVISAGAFSKTGGYTNVYQANVEFAASGWARMWEDGVALSRVASLATLDATAGRYHIVVDPVGSTPSTLTLYVHATGSGNPGANGKVYEYNHREYGVFSQAPMVVSNVHTRRQLANNGSFEVGISSMLTSITAHDGTKHNILIHKGTVLRYCTLTDSYYAGQTKTMLVVNDTTAAGEDVWIEQCLVTETVEGGGSAYYGHTNSGGLYGTVTLKNSGTGAGVFAAVPGFSNTVGMVIDGGTYASGVTVLGSATSVLRNATFSDQIQVPYDTLGTIDNVTISCFCTNGVIRLGTGSAVTASIDIRESSLTNSNDFDVSVYVSANVTLSTLTLLNNEFFAVQPLSHIAGDGAVNLPTNATINGNTYHYTTSPDSVISYRGISYNLPNATHWSNWQALGFDATGSRVTP